MGWLLFCFGNNRKSHRLRLLEDVGKAHGDVGGGADVVPLGNGEALALGCYREIFLSHAEEEHLRDHRKTTHNDILRSRKQSKQKPGPNIQIIKYPSHKIIPGTITE